MKRWLTVLLFPLFAHATAFSTDWTDLWLDPQEPGWGVTIYQQHDTLFTTFFVYGPGGGATWYTASSMPYSGAVGTTFNFSGALFQMQGTSFAAPWNPGALGQRQVGTVNIAFTSINQGTLTYTVDGVQVSKPLIRYAFKRNSIAGEYIGATIGTYTGCAQNGYSEEPATFTVTQNGTSVVIRAQLLTTGATCTYSGTMEQAGRLSYMDGILACSSGSAGTFSALELHANISGLTGRASSNLGGTCRWTGRIGGLRRN
jgi:hypothetical protein